MKTIRKWLLYQDGMDVVVIKKDINPFIPINRMLDKSGMYHFSGYSNEIGDYLIVYDPNEPYGEFSKILVSKVSHNTLVGLTHEDYLSLYDIIPEYMKLEIPVSQ